ncbi:hypothetical protein LSH36_100g00052 [Paralvinella palmiformis]|uniref:Phosphoribosyltransferase domain-containing protein n=1 Tax=Paralvinella palmiformis TaxID=53620 RepID=A0AAD9K1D2_9ANNE|nr:hypothetical protein LSH36_100g00052 [Paralvinella palmiformis]
MEPDVTPNHLSVMNGTDYGDEFGTNLIRIGVTDQIKELQTVLRDKGTSRSDFIFYADRLIRIVVEEGLNQLPYKKCTITTPTGEAMEQGLRDCCRSIRIGKILIQSDEDTHEAKIYYAKFPPDIHKRKVLLMYPIMSTGNTINKAVVVLKQHQVEEQNIIILNLFCTPVGIRSVISQYPKMKILTSEVHPVAPNHFGTKYFGTD